MLIVKNNYLSLENRTTANVNESTLPAKLLTTFLLAYIVPIFGLYGIFVLPDSGLILGLSIMLWASDNIVRQQLVSIKNSLFLALGLGIGLLSKYHILPLGGGMLLGLYIDLLCQNRQANWLNLAKLALSIVLCLIIAAPLFVWNYANHYASFIFQLQHGFTSNGWRISTMFEFILGILLYLTPWFAYLLVRDGIFKNRKYYILIPVIALSLILLISSLRKVILPHWLAPAFWLLIPYLVINTSKLKFVKAMCKYTSILWILLIILLLTPGGMLNIKKVAKLFNVSASSMIDILLWQELPGLFNENTDLQHSIARLNTNSPNCHFSYKLIGTMRWFWAAQLEYHKAFPAAYKILNLDLQSSNFYIWRDNLTNFANCRVVIIADRDNLKDMANLIDIKNSYTIHGIGDYKSLNLTVVEGVFKDAAIIKPFQQTLLKNPHY
ncbi:MAG: phospholipid carrier-dependent glycosyltransferase [Burkholderiales bacterium]|jgi:hypothetical protein|nr:phospholipid carrier-dependent glycosyltransferase [Burkholderiales bacterium]